MKAAIVATGMLLALAGAAEAAEGWTRLTGADLNNALVSRRLRYAEGGEISFAEDGTMRLAGQTIQRGYWKVDEKDRLCQDWAPQDEWICVKVERKDDGEKLRFIDATGAATVATYRAW